MRTRFLRFHLLDHAACLAFLGYSTSATVTPIVLVILSQELGFGLVGGGSLEVSRSALIFATLLCSGFLAAHFGKARSLGWGLLLLGAGMALYSQANAYWMLLVALGLAGVGGGVVEALINPLVEELHREDAGRYLNFVNGFWSVGVLGTMLVGGEVITRARVWRPVLVGAAGVALVAGALFLFLRNHGERQRPSGLSQVLGHKLTILRSRGFWLFTSLMFFGGASEGMFTYWSASYLQLEHGFSARVGGWGTATFALGMIFTRFAGGVLVPQRHLKSFVALSAVTGVLVSLLFPFLQGIAPLFAALFLAGVSVACFWPSLQALAVERLRLDATSLFILLSCGGISGFSAASWLMGWTGARMGLRHAWFLAPICFLILLVLLSRVAPPPGQQPRKRQARNQKGNPRSAPPKMRIASSGSSQDLG